MPRRDVRHVKPRVPHRNDELGVQQEWREVAEMRGA